MTDKVIIDTLSRKNVEIKIERRKVKNTRLVIKPNKDIVLISNENVQIETLKEFAESKSGWIDNSLNYFNKFISDERQLNFENGDTVFHLGNQYTIKMIIDTENKIILENKSLLFFTKDMNYEHNKSYFEKWEREQAEIVFKDSLDRMIKLFKLIDFEVKFNVRKMKIRWGSCLTDKKTINLNIDLIKCPLYCIDYIVLHELLHFEYPKHDQRFVGALSILMPDWKDRKKYLDEIMINEI